MQFNEIYEKTVYAFEHDEVFELLTGQKGYAYQAPRYVADVPTCDEFIFRDGIYPYYKTLSNEERQSFLNNLTSAFDKMIVSDNEVYVWWAVSLLYGQKLSESKYNDSPFFIADTLLAKIKPALLANKRKLETSHQYEGKGVSNGLWRDVQRYNTLLLKHFNYILLG